MAIVKLDEEAAAERAHLSVAAAGMTVEEYQNYWKETNEIFGGSAPTEGPAVAARPLGQEDQERQSVCTGRLTHSCALL